MAIVSGDVAGYARLIAVDETAAVRQLSELRQEVERHVSLQEGELFDFTGDNFLAGFSSARSAVLFAIGLQDKVAECNSGLPQDRRMEFRLGVHQGDVRVEDHRVFGTGGNIAARLESSGDPGGVNISSAVREQILGRLDLECEDLGERTVKNIPDPVRARLALIVHYQSSGEDVPARRIASEILSANPDYTAALAASTLTQQGLVPKEVSDLVQISLQSAGLP
jgi:adenylate cyclase